MDSRGSKYGPILGGGGGVAGGGWINDINGQSGKETIGRNMNHRNYHKHDRRLSQAPTKYYSRCTLDIIADL